MERKKNAKRLVHILVHNPEMLENLANKMRKEKRNSIRVLGEKLKHHEDLKSNPNFGACCHLENLLRYIGFEEKEAQTHWNIKRDDNFEKNFSDFIYKNIPHDKLLQMITEA